VLRPIKAKSFIPAVAKQVGVDEETTTAIINYYWQEVRKSLSGLKHSRVHVSNLGDFVVKHWKLDEKIAKLERFEEYNRQKGLQQMTARFKTVETLFDMKSLKAIMSEEKQRAEFIKHHKKTLNDTKQHYTDLEAQGSDHGGDQE
jgi:HD-like signal output (HDOD) protein